MNAYQQAINQYKNIELESKVQTASPHELISLLLQGAKSHIKSAQTCLKHKQTANKGHHIGKAISILGGLRASLDKEKAQQLSDKLDGLYEYIQHVLLKANIDNDNHLLQESHDLIDHIYTGWDAIKTKPEPTPPVN